ncbi:hypothetical protein DPMN_061521 [Dreissena polymorpha]|uniref:Uncharacterized protein n=1 Tax=Dreissena polymorpha TaxID=45954 RepID=A0A9D4HH02_DREPO|nr:hypothetical protein DPMN_061521 [Dreissena polymorpha]
MTQGCIPQCSVIYTHTYPREPWDSRLYPMVLCDIPTHTLESPVTQGCIPRCSVIYPYIP